MEKNYLKKWKTVIGMVFITGFALLLYGFSRYNYLLFHTIAELFSIVIACGLFMIAWNSRKQSENPELVLLGIAYLFIGILDLFHTLSYKGMNIFHDYDFHANQLWIAARYMESLTLFVFSLNIMKKRNGMEYAALLLYTLVTLGTLLSIYIWKIFPVCFVPGLGQTPFKIISEYVVSAILLASAFLFRKQRAGYDKRVFNCIFWSIIITVFAELFFTLYVDNYGITNLIGHYLKIISFYLIYRAIIVTGLKEPYNLIFKKLSDQQEKLREAVQTRDTFFSIIAHDLKNPLSGIKSISALLKDDYSGFSEEEKIEFIKDIYRTAEGSTKLLENLLLWARSQTNRIKPQIKDFALFPILKEEYGLVEPIAQAKEITLSFHAGEELQVIGDPEMIRTVLRNLLTNAVKFINPGGSVALSGEALPQSVSITVADNGVGMTEEEMARLFSLDKHSSKKGTAKEEGSGLGLLLCKEFVDKNGGTISVESVSGRGSTFTLILPGHENPA